MGIISESTIEQVKRVPVLQLAEALGYELKRVGSSYHILCPNCGGKNTYINPAKNIFKCFGNKHTGMCGCAGNSAISFFNWHQFGSNDTKNFPQCVIGIAELMGIPIEYEDGTKHIPKRMSRRKRQFTPIKQQQEQVAQNPEVVDKVYRAFLSLSPIRKEHAQEWLGRRYTKEEIKLIKLRSVPDFKEAASILLTLKSKGYPLERIPGFTQKFFTYKPDYPEELLEYDQTNKGYWAWTITAYSGYFIPIRDILGRIVRLRIRREKGDPKYIWFSSAENFHIEQDKRKWRKGGASSGAPLNIAPPPNVLRNWEGDIADYCDTSTLIAVEGEHKAAISAKILKKVVVGVPGVSNYKAIIPLLKDWDVKKFIIAYDMDSIKDQGEGKNQQVFDFLVAFAKDVIKVGIVTCVWTWDPAHGKGLDDLLLNKCSPMEINLLTKERKMVDIKNI